MPRVRPADRLDQLAAAAVKVFSAKGFRKTLMSDVAQEMGVSSGLLYSYVESKEALFHFALDWARSNGTKPAPELPIPTPGPGDTTALVAGVLRTGLAQPALREALRRERADDPATELTQIVIEHYRATNATRQLITMVIIRKANEASEAIAGKNSNRKWPRSVFIDPRLNARMK